VTVGDKVWVRPEAGSTEWRRGEILRVSLQPDDYEVQVTTENYVDVTWFYAAELRPRGVVDLLGEVVS